MKKLTIVFLTGLSLSAFGKMLSFPNASYEGTGKVTTSNGQTMSYEMTVSFHNNVMKEWVKFENGEEHNFEAKATFNKFGFFTLKSTDGRWPGANGYCGNFMCHLDFPGGEGEGDSEATVFFHTRGIDVLGSGTYKDMKFSIEHSLSKE